MTRRTSVLLTKHPRHGASGPRPRSPKATPIRARIGPPRTCVTPPRERQGHTAALRPVLKCAQPRPSACDAGVAQESEFICVAPDVFEATAGVSPRAQTGTDRLGRVRESRMWSDADKGDLMNLKRWWCAITTHKWRRERHEGVDQLHCRRCGFVTNVDDEARQARHWDSTGFGA